MLERPWVRPGRSVCSIPLSPTNLYQGSLTRTRSMSDTCAGENPAPDTNAKLAHREER